MRGDRIQADGGQPVQRRPQADHARDVRRAGLEFVGQIGVFGFLEGHQPDHVAAALVRWHGFEQRLLAVQHADPARPVNLVAGEGVELAIEFAHVHRQMRDRLRAVHQHRDASGVGQVDHELDRVDGPERVGQVDKRHQLHPPAAEQPLVLVQDQFAGVGEGHDFQRRAGALAQQLPGHDVGVVLHAGDDDLVAGLDRAAAETARHQVDAFGGAAGENDFLDAGRVQKGAHLFPRALVGGGGSLRQQVNAPVDVGVIAGVTPADGVDDRFRFLHRGGVVQIDQGLAVNPLMQDRKIGADAGEVQPGAGGRRGGKRVRGAHVVHSPSMRSRAKRLASRRVRRSRSGVSRIGLRLSLAKAPTSMARA